MSDLSISVQLYGSHSDAVCGVASVFMTFSHSLEIFFYDATGS